MGMFDFVLGSGNAGSVSPNVEKQAANAAALADTIKSNGLDTNANYNTLYKPVEQQFVNDAANYDSQANQDLAAGEAGAQVRSSFDKVGKAGARYLASLGINPNSGRALDTVNQTNMTEAANEAGAMNDARLKVRQQGINLRGGVINQGNTVANRALNEEQAALGGYNTSGNISIGGANAQANIADANTKNQAMNADLLGSVVGAGAGLYTGGIGALAY